MIDFSQPPRGPLPTITVDEHGNMHVDWPTDERPAWLPITPQLLDSMVAELNLNRQLLGRLMS